MQRFADRYLTVACDNGFSVIWDRQEEQVIDVIAAGAARYADEDALWDEGRAIPARDLFRMAA